MKVTEPYPPGSRNVTRKRQNHARDALGIKPRVIDVKPQMMGLNDLPMIETTEESFRYAPNEKLHELMRQQLTWGTPLIDRFFNRVVWGIPTGIVLAVLLAYGVKTILTMQGFL